MRVEEGEGGCVRVKEGVMVEEREGEGEGGKGRGVRVEEGEGGV